MRAVIYTRVSHDPTQQARSVTEQEAECRAWCQRQGWEVVRVFTDNDRGASRHSRKQRPEYARLRSYLAERQADALVMWEGSRAQRDVRDYLSLRDLCADHGIAYAYSGRIYDLTRTDDRFATGLDALLAEREADVTRDRVLRAQRAAAAAGKPWGKRPYGYTRQYNESRQLVAQAPHPTQAPIVVEIVKRAVAGESCYAIAADLNDRGLPSPAGATWCGPTVRRVAINPLYIGKRVHRGQVVATGQWEPLISEELHAQVVARLTDPDRNTARQRELTHMLSGILRCGVCGGRTAVIKNRGYLAYACKVAFCVAARTTTIETYVRDVVTARLARPDARDVLMPPGRTGGAGVHRQRALQLRARLDDFYATAAEGQLTPAALAAIEARLLPQIQDADRRSRVAAVPKVVVDLIRPDAAQAWETVPITGRRDVIRYLMRLAVKRTGRGRRRFDPERVAIEWQAHWPDSTGPAPGKDAEPAGQGSGIATPLRPAATPCP